MSFMQSVPGAQALISEDGVYRYWLSRRLPGKTGPAATWVMLNPSTADALKNDATVRRVIGFSERAGFRAFRIVNLFAVRSKNPEDIWKSSDPVGPEGDYWLRACLSTDTPVILAWGAHNTKGRAAGFLQMAKDSGRDLYCLGKSRAGHPKHPLFLAADTPLERWT